MEEYIVEVLAKSLGGYVNYSYDPEIDGIIVDRKGRPKAVVEVKWGRVKGSDVDRFLERTESISSNRILVTKTRISRDGVKTLLPKDIVGLFM